MRKSKDIIVDLNQFEPQDDNWLELETLLDELWATGGQEKFTAELLAVFERFPEENGAGVFWSIVHGVERFKAYEKEIIDSLNRQPSHMGLVMLMRIKNTGAKNVDGVEIDKLATDLLAHGRTTPTLRKELIAIREK